MSIGKRLENIETRIVSMPPKENNSIDLSRLTLDELRELRALCSKAGDERDWYRLNAGELARAESLMDKIIT